MRFRREFNTSPVQPKPDPKHPFRNRDEAVRDIALLVLA